jgi:hypothetical protein
MPPYSETKHMAEMKPRRSLQLRPSTVTALMFVAGMLVWANVRYYEKGADGLPFSSQKQYGWGGETLLGFRGWPLPWHVRVVASQANMAVSSGVFAAPLDLLFAMIVLGAVACGFEGVVRKKIQVHLSTMIGVVCLAGLVIWINTINSWGDEVTGSGYGFPCIFLRVRSENDIHWMLTPLFSNAVIGVCASIDAAFAFEWLIRRRERQQP